MRDAHGLKGEIFVALKAKRADWLDALEIMRLSGPSLEPKEFTVKSARAHKDGLIVVLDDVTDRSQAESLRGRWVEIPQAYIVADEGESLFLGQYLGLKIKDKTLGEVGKVVDLTSNGAQDMLVVETKKGRFEIPLVEDFVLETDLKSGVILMDLPEGLVEV